MTLCKWLAIGFLMTAAGWLPLSGQSIQTAPSAGSAQAAAAPAPAAGAAVYTPEQQYLFDLFKTRRSVRKYLPTPVPEEHIRQILDSARTSPTSGNQQPWKFLVIRDRAKLDRLLDATVEHYAALYKEKKNPSDAELAQYRDKIRAMDEPYLRAPVFIVVLTDSQSMYPTYNHFDGPMAAGYLFLAARALGYGTVFCTDSFPFEVVKRALGIPDRYEVVCSTPLGVPDGWPVSKEKKPLESFIAYETLEK